MIYTMSKTKYFCVLFFLAFLLMVSFPVKAHAEYKSWVRGTSDYNSYKGGPDTVTAQKPNKEETEKLLRDKDPNPIEKFFAEIIVDFGSAITQALKAGGIDASTTGIVMGKFTTGVNVFVFDLDSQNPWGIIGAYLYVFFRNISMALILVFATINVGRAVIFGKDRGLGEVKEQIYTLILLLLLLFIMPQVVDWICEARDIMAMKAFTLLGDIGDTMKGVRDTNLHETISLEGEYLKQFANSENPEDATPSLLNALIYLGICILPLFYIVSYLGLALTEAVLFGCFPLIMIFSMSDKKAIHGWCTVVFTNLLVPLLDMILIMLPALVMLIIESLISKGGDTATEVKGGLLKALIMIVMFSLVIPTRNKILSVLGNSYGGIKGGFGVGALAGLGMMAARAAKGAKNALSGGKGGESGEGGESKGEANSSDAEAGKSLEDLQKNLDDVRPEAENSGGNNDSEQDAENNGGPADLPDPGDAPDNGEFATDSGADNGDEFSDYEGMLSDGDAAAMDISSDAVDGLGSGADADAFASSDVDVTNIGSGIAAYDGGESSYSGTGDGEAGNVGLTPEGEGVNDGYVSTDPKAAESDMNEHTQQNNPIEGDDMGDGEIVPTDAADGMKADSRISDDLNDADGSFGANAAANAEIKASQMIQDATVKSNELGNPMDAGLRKTIEDNSPVSNGADKDLDKKMNLSRAANLQTMDNLKGRMEALDRENISAQASIAADSNLMSRNTAKLASLDRKEAKILDKYKSAGSEGGSVAMDAKDEGALNSIRSERQQLENANMAAQENINTAKASIATNNVAKQAISSELSKRSNIETDFGKMQERRGLSGQTFSSAKDFSKQVVHDNLVRQTANYKNFTNTKYAGVLTPQERTQFRRQQNIRRAVGATGKVVGDVAAGAALTAVGAGAAIALSVGGGEAGAALGGAIAAKGVGTMVKGAAVPVTAVGGAIKEGTAHATTMAISGAAPHVEAAAVKAGNATKTAAGKAVDMARRKAGTATRIAASSLERQFGGGPSNYYTPANSHAAAYAEKVGVLGADEPKPKRVPRKFSSGGSSPVASADSYNGSSEADLFMNEMNLGSDDPVVRQRAHEARSEANRNVRNYNNGHK